MTFLELQTEVQSMLIDTPGHLLSYVPTWVRRAHRELQRKHNYKVLEHEAAYTTSIGSHDLGPIPADWKEARGKPYFLRNDGSIRGMDYVRDRHEALRRFENDETGSPRALEEYITGQGGGGDLYVWPLTDSLSDWSGGEYRVRIPFWRWTAELSADDDTDWFTTQEITSQFIIERAVSMGFLAFEDEARAKIHNDLATALRMDAEDADKLRRLAKFDTMVPRSGAREVY